MTAAPAVVLGTSPSLNENFFPFFALFRGGNKLVDSGSSARPNNTSQKSTSSADVARGGFEEDP